MKHSGYGPMREAPSSGPGRASTDDGDRLIAAFLAALDSGAREGFLGFVEHNESIYEIWLYAGVIGYEGSFEALEAWVRKRYPKLNRRQLLLAEIVRLQNDIEQVRLDDSIRPDAAASRIASLSKELRGHIVEVDKISRATDRRGLILAGADRTMRLLREMFCKDEAMVEALEEGFQAVWAQLHGEG